MGGADDQRRIADAAPGDFAGADGAHAAPRRHRQGHSQCDPQQLPARCADEQRCLCLQPGRDLGAIDNGQCHLRSGRQRPRHLRANEDGYAVYGFDGGSNANRGYAGYFYSTNGIGVYGYSGGNRTHPNILAPGVYGQSNQGVGVYGRGDTSNSYSFYNEGGYFEGGKGLYARGTDSASEQGYGARIFSSNYRGMYVQGSG